MSNYSKNNSRNVGLKQYTKQCITRKFKILFIRTTCFFQIHQDLLMSLKTAVPTLVNLQRIDKVSAKRIIDFLSGTVYAIGGDIRRVGTDIFLCTPDNVEVVGSITDHIENEGTSFD